MYVIDAANQLRVISEIKYDREIDLQTLVADHPALLGGNQMNRAQPRTFLLIAAQAGIGISEFSGSQFSLDLLFIDQDGVPTLVEVKRSSDLRIRREVIAQLLEYAANFCGAWSADRMRATFEERCELKGVEPSAEALALDVVPGAFIYDNLWVDVATNLKIGKLRLVLLADEIPITSLRIIEYLNLQMGSTEVYAVKVSQHVGGGVRILSTDVLNTSQEAVDRKNDTGHTTRSRPWTSERFYAELEKCIGSEGAASFQEIAQWANGTADVVPFPGSGSIQITAVRNPALYDVETDVVFLTLKSNGHAQINFEYLMKKPPFDSADLREQLRLRLNELLLVSITGDQLQKRPSIQAGAFKDPLKLAAFLNVQDWIVERFRVAWKINDGLLSAVF